MSNVLSALTTLPDFTYGNTILLNDGIYTDINITITNEGTISDPIIIKAKNSGKVFFSGKVNITISGRFIIISNIIFTNGSGNIILKGSYNRITNCEFSLNNGNGPVLTIYKFSNRVDHNIFKNFSKLNPWIEVIHSNDAPDYIIIDSNIFMNRKKGTGNGFETIRFGLSGSSLSQSYSVIENNIFKECNGEIEIISNKAGGNIYYKNTFISSYGSLTLRHGNKVIVAKNKFLQNNLENGGGIRVAAGSGHIIYNNMFKDTNIRAALIINSGSNSNIYNIQVSHSKFLRNIFINCSLDIALGSQQFLYPPRSCSIKDNIIIKNDNDPVYTLNTDIIDFEFENNLYNATNIGNIPSSYNQKSITNFSEKIIENDFGATEEKIGYDAEIIFDNKYGYIYYKYLNNSLFEEINNISLNKYYRKLSDENNMLDSFSVRNTTFQYTTTFVLLLFFLLSFFC